MDTVVRPGAGARSAPALVLRNLSKTFSGAPALKDVALTVEAGEVHGLLGQNGSGKSTLIKILAGYHEPEPGATLELFGRPVPLPLEPGAFRKYGIAFVHQHLGLIPSLSVVENLRIGMLAEKNLWSIAWREEVERARRTFAKYGLAIDPLAPVGSLPQVMQAMLAIVRAVDEIQASQDQHGGLGLLVLDEPTPFLPRAGVDQLFALVRTVVAHGASVIFVSHDVDEVMEITDRATVLRDGVVAGTLVTRESKADDFVERIVGRKVALHHIAHHALDSRPVEIAVSGLSGGTLRDISLQVRRGEILGLTGLIGTGYDEVLALLYGSRAARAGELVLKDRRYSLPSMTPGMALAAGIAFLPADRLGAGGIGSLSLMDNVTLPVLDLFRRQGMLDRAGMSKRTRELGERYDVRPNDPARTLESLSGGNQQKVLLAKWLQTEPALMLLDEPTQGVDVGARQQVYVALDQAAQHGTAILVASTDYEQLEQICDRVLVFARGEVIRELAGDQVTKDHIAEQCYLSMTLSGQIGTRGELRA